MGNGPGVLAINTEPALDPRFVEHFYQDRSPAIFLNFHGVGRCGPQGAIGLDLHGGDAERVEMLLHRRRDDGFIPFIDQGGEG